MSEIDKLEKKAALLGIDVPKFIQELTDLVAGKVQVDTTALARDIAASMPTPEPLNVDEVVAKLRESLPENAGGSIDLVELKGALEKSLWERMEAEFTQLANDIKGRLEAIRQETRDGIDAVVETKLLAALSKYRDEMKAAAGAGGAAGNGAGAAGMGGDKFDKALLVLDRFLDRQDPLANIEQLSETYARLGNLFGGGPDPSLLYRGSQQALIEGIKIGARARGGQAPAAPFSLNRRDVPSPGRARHSSVDRIIESL